MGENRKNRFLWHGKNDFGKAAISQCATTTIPHVSFLVFILVIDPLSVEEESDDCVEMHSVRIYL